MDQETHKRRQSPPLRRLLIFLWFKIERNRVDAVAFSCFIRRPVIEHMSEMCIADCTDNFSTVHAVRTVIFQLHRSCFCNIIETWPSSTRLKFCIGLKQRASTYHTVIHSALFVFQIFSGKGSFCSSHAADLVLFRSELFVLFHFYSNAKNLLDSLKHFVDFAPEFWRILMSMMFDSMRDRSIQKIFSLILRSSHNELAVFFTWHLSTISDYPFSHC